LTRVLVVLCTLMLTPVVAFALWSRIEAARLDKALDAIEARGESLDLSSWDSEPRTAEQQQAARLYLDAAQALRGVVVAKFLPAAKIIDELGALPPGAPAADPRLERLKEIEAPYEQVLAMTERAAAMDARPPEGQAGFSSLLAIHPLGSIRVARCAFSGDGAGAMKALVALLRARRALPRAFRGYAPPTANSLGLILTFGTASPAALEDLQREYASIGSALDEQDQLRYDRAWFLQFALPSQFGGFDGSRRGPLERVLAAVQEPLRSGPVMEQLAYYEQALDVARQPWPAKLDLTDSIVKAAGGPWPPMDRPLSFMAMLRRPWGGNPALAQLSQIVTRSAEAATYARASTAANALARYRVAHGGVLPATLSDLVPAYIAAVPIDPYTGRDIYYRREGMSYRVYGAGMNRKDDGAVWDVQSDVRGNSRRGDPPDVGIAVGAWR
jgi:hypothetical protein